MKKKKGAGPIFKLTVIIILVVLAGFLIFYSIDNPDFWKSRFLSDPEVQNSAVDAGSAAAGTDSNENQEDDGDEGPSFWQIITGLFKGEENDEAPENGYPEKLELNFYFSGLEEEKKLVPEKRTITAGNSETAVRNAVGELLKGPSKPYHFPVIPAGTELIDAWTYENIAVIDLSQEYLDESLDNRILDEYIIYSIVNTLTEIPGIEGVIFYIEGIRIKVYGDIDLSIPAIKNKEYIEEQ